MHAKCVVQHRTSFSEELIDKTSINLVKSRHVILCKTILTHMNEIINMGRSYKPHIL